MHAQKKPHTALDIFMHARGYHIAVNLLGKPRAPEIMVDLVYAHMTLAAFVSEIYLKCLLHIQGQQNAKGHHLDVLFSKLKRETQESIDGHWNRLTAHLGPFYKHVDEQVGYTVPRDLRSSLAASRRSFELLRYSYEGERADFGVAALPDCLRLAILEIHPEWERLRKHSIPIGKMLDQN